jgi:hypothetical protein
MFLQRLASSRRAWSAAYLAGCATWLAALVASPYILSHPSVPEPALRAAVITYAAGALVCHQRPERSFRVWGLQMPVCARCTGIYAGAAAGALAMVAWAWSRRRAGQGGSPPGAWRRRLLAAAAPTAITLGLEWSGAAGVSSLARALAGVPLGVVVSWLVVDAIRSEPVATPWGKL